jgi:alpha-N-arabinofuranosidase
MKKHHAVCVLLLSGLGAAAASPETVPNLIENASFEQAAGDTPAGWNRRVWGGSGTFTCASIGRTGGRSVQLGSERGADISWIQDVPVKPGTEYRLAGWIKTENVAGATGALLNVHNLQPVQTNAVTGTRDWTRVECRFETAHHQRIQINCLFGGWGLSTGTAWFDDIRLTEIPATPRMYYTDTTYGRPFAKDPDVAQFKGRYWMYYTVARPGKGIAIGIARSDDLTHWQKAGDMLPGPAYEKNGLGAPAAIVLRGKVHLFYQTYGNGPRDAICHAWSDDGIRFTRNASNPIFRPTGAWNCGRAIDAEVVPHGERLLLYWATRDPRYKIQMVGVSAAPLESDFSRETWTQLCDEPVLAPRLPWEKQCIEAPSVTVRNGRLYMFYAGAYNNEPQQIGCAVSADGVAWERLSDYPLLPNGREGEWNSSESGHPGVFEASDGRHYLFFQGNNDRGKTWYLSKMEVAWENGEPSLVRPRDGKEFRLRKTREAVLQLDAGETKAPVSTYIYGQFIEHLGRCIYGGIWAEMLEDRKFYHAVPARRNPWGRTGAGASVLRDSPWKVVGPRISAVRMVTTGAYVGKHEPEITLEGGPAGIKQEDLAVVAGKTYGGRVVLAGDETAAPIHVSLVWGTGTEVSDTVTIERIGQKHTTYPLTFTARASSEQARLEIVGTGRGAFRVGAVSLMPGDNVSGFRADTLALLKDLNAPVYRWPGGNFVSGYDWRDGLGDPDRRPTRSNPAWTGLEYNDVGIHEFMELCRLLDAEPYIAVNTGQGSVEGARLEVEYCNGAPDTPMGAWRAKNGHPEPFGVKFWAVGNEMYGNWQLGHMPLADYVKKHNAVAAAMWKADPSAQLVAVGAVGRWSEVTLEQCADHMTMISEHFYNQGRSDVVAHVAQIPNNVKRIADAHRRYRRQIDGLEGREIRIALDEWNYWYGPHVYGELGTRYFHKDGLGIAAGLHELIRNSDMYFMANYAQTVNVIGCIKTTKTAAAFETTALPLMLYRKEFGVVPVAVRHSAAPLDAVAAWTADRRAVTVGIVNPTDTPYKLELDARGVQFTGEGTHWLIEHADPMAYNEPGKKPHVAIVERQLSGMNAVTGPPLSIGVYRLSVR